MAFVKVDDDKTWKGQEGLIHCPQVVSVTTDDTPYLEFDFTDTIPESIAITGTPTLSEVDSKTITTADVSVDNSGKRVSFKVSAFAAGEFTLRCAATYSDGTTNVNSLQGTLLAS